MIESDWGFRSRPVIQRKRGGRSTVTNHQRSFQFEMLFSFFLFSLSNSPLSGSNNERMSLVRQNSSSSLGSLNRPLTFQSSTHVTKEKATKVMMARRNSRRNSTKPEVEKKATPKKEEKKGDAASILLSPTPYWKVARERGKFSPPQTRSAKKRGKGRRLDYNSHDDAEDKENEQDENVESKPDAVNPGVLLFSPPDQDKNRRREREEIQKKEDNKNKRICNARESGQYMEFSPTGRLRTSLPPETTETTNTSSQEIDEESNSPGKSQKVNPNRSNEISCKLNNVRHDPPASSTSTIQFVEETEHEEKLDRSSSPTDMEVEIEPDAETSQVSANFTQASMYNAEITNDIKSIKDSLNLLSSNSNTEKDKQISEARIMSETLSVQNAKLEERIERFEIEFKNIESKTSSERERLIVEKTKIQDDLAASKREADSKIENLEEANQKLELRCVDLKNEINKILDEKNNLSAKYTNARNLIEKHKEMVDEVKQHRSKESEEVTQLKQTNLELTKENSELKARKEELVKLVAECEQKIDMLEKSLLPESEAQLQEALAKLDRYDMASTQIKAYEQTVQELKAELQDARQEKEEERQNFQDLNEDSSKAFSQLASDVEDRNQQIRKLQERIKEVEVSLDEETKKFSSVSADFESLKSSTGCRIRELEDSLRSSCASVEQLTAEKQEVEHKLDIAQQQVREDAKEKEKFISTIEKNSSERKEMHSTTQSMQQRIDHLEEHLQLAKRERDDARQRLETSDDREEDLFAKLRESHRVRRELHNRVMQLSGNIRVYVRVRPMLPDEKRNAAESSTHGGRKSIAAASPSRGGRKSIAAASPSHGGKKRKHVEIESGSLFKFPGMGSSDGGKSSLGSDDPTKNLIEVTEPKKDRGGLSERQKKHRFGFDHVFNQSHNQEDVWDATKPLVQSAVDGFNVTIFAYGQTSSGKTFTTLGENGNEGLVPRAVQKLFDSKRELEEMSRGNSKVEICVELLEVYNEQVRDLLFPNAGSEGKELNLKVTANEAVGSVHLPVSNEEEVFKILSVAQKRRCVKATASNAVSSRSHMLFTIHFKVVSKSGTRSGKLNICDLAGSERLGKSEANAHVGSSLLKETKHINLSLSTLSNVIEKLQAGDSNVPYRESKLTYLLQNCLGGNSKTLAIVCCNPLQSHYHETLCSLRFAAKVNRVDLKAQANISY